MRIEAGASVAQACDALGIAPASYYRWRNREDDGLPHGVARKLIVGAARTAFKEMGMDASLSLIAEAAGVARQTIYNLYGSKKLLLLDVLRDIYAGLLVLDQDPDETETLEEGLRLFGRRFLDMAVDDDAVMVNRLTIAHHRTDPEIARMIFELARQNASPGLIARLGNYLERQRSAGRIACDDPRLMAGVFQSAVSGSIRLRAMAGVSQPRSDLEAHLECAIALFLSGLAVSPEGAGAISTRAK